MSAGGDAYRSGREQERARGRRGAFVLLTSAVVVVVVLAALVGAEVLVRRALAHQVIAYARPALGGRIDVDLGSSPALVDVARRRVDTVTLHAPDTAVCGIDGLDVEAGLDSVRRVHGEVTVDRIADTVDAPTQSVANAVEPLLGAIARVEPDPDDGELVLHLGPGGALTLRERVELDGSTARLRPASAPGSSSGGLLGGILSGLGTVLGARTTATVDLGHLPLGLHPTGLSVVPSGLRLQLAGGPATVPASGVDVSGAGCPSLSAAS